MNDNMKGKMTNYRWVICTMLFFATTINYMDRQVLSLTWVDFIAPEFGWTNNDYGDITSLFSIFYAVSMLFAGRFVDWMGTKKGFMWAIFIWSLGACIHAFCGIATSGAVAGEWALSFHGAREAIAVFGIGARVTSVSVTLFVFARLVLAVGESGNFPAAIKTTAEYFPKKDRAFATSIFNSGAQIGALLAPISIPFIAKAWGWEMSFIVIGALGFIWMGFWQFLYKKPEENPFVNKAELAYILQDNEHNAGNVAEKKAAKAQEKKLSFAQCFKFRQTWAFAVGKFLTDGVWWFYLFWTPAYLSSVYGMSSTDAALPIFILYMITMLSIAGGWLPTYFVDKKGMNPYAGRMRAMLIFAFFPLLALLAQPLGHISYWIPIVIIGIAGAAHQSWSANIFSTIGDMFPKSAVATITGIGGMAGGVGSYLINKGSGVLFDFSANTNMKLFGFEGINSGYFIIFSICAIAYLLGWVIMKALVPKYAPIVAE
jgi:ACS family hexuronate transporter-like MFS transporter